MKFETSKKRKSSIHLYWRITLFSAFFCYLAWNTFPSAPVTNVQSSMNGRKLLGTNCTDKLQAELDGEIRIPDAFTAEQLRGGAWVLYLLGMMYMFLALSIVCDEVFVPALDVAVEKMGISPDVAGATLMAAGGSAPELATSGIGTFLESDVGFGTIVGSAVFNVLFVLGMCVLFSKEVLQLTWWPLFRDCTVYAFGLLVLALFFVVSTPKQIDWWEALILLLMYGGYVFIMSKNKQLEQAVKGCIGSNQSNKMKELKQADDEEDEEEGANIELKSKADTLEQSDLDRLASSRRLGHRHTVLQFAKGEPFVIAAERLVIDKIRGDCEETFKQIDVDGDGSISHDEFRGVVLNSELNPTDEEINDLINELDLNGDGKITKDEFRTWYKKSRKRLHKDADEAFSKYSKTHDGVESTHKKNIRKILSHIDKVSTKYKDSDEHVKTALEELEKESLITAEGLISKDNFFKWYQDSDHSKQAQNMVEEALEDADDVGGLDLSWPDNTRAQIVYVISFPLVFPMYITSPNVQTKKWESWWPFTFAMAILWVIIWSYFMVQWATVFGLTMGIPTKVMGLVFLAAGTSIPDLLTSVFVAMNGKGDMAVSSSIGSNIFDILVGLPLPWLIRSGYTGGEATMVGSPEDNVGLSVLILMAVVILVIVTIAAVGWKLNKALAFVFFFFYFVYVAQELIIYYTIGPGKSGCL